jgi:uncharacterized lipoprotein YbaY
MRESTVTGSILFPDKTKLPPGAKLRIRLTDTTMQDAQAAVLAEEVVEDVSERVNEGKPVSFRLTAPEPPPNADCSVEVHVDVDGAGFESFASGDYLNARRENVLTYGRPKHVDVNVRQI